MPRLLESLRPIAPDFLKDLYGQSRAALRSASRSLGGKVATCRVRDVVVRIGVSSEMEQYRADTYATKEPETLDWLDQTLNDGDVFFDVGANIGLYALYAAKVKPKCSIFAFEPEAQNFSRLCRNIALNHARNLIPCNFPLSDREAFDYFYVGELQAGSALHSFGQASGARPAAGDVPLKQGALSTTLDALVGKYGVPQPALIKIDVDGIEEKILAGAARVLESDRLRSVLFELNLKDGASASEPEQRLTRFGFRLARKSDWTQELNGLRSQNCIFQRP